MAANLVLILCAWVAEQGAGAIALGLALATVSLLLWALARGN